MNRKRSPEEFLRDMRVMEEQRKVKLDMLHEQLYKQEQTNFQMIKPSASPINLNGYYSKISMKSDRKEYSSKKKENVYPELPTFHP